jgi:hypothetical protein
MAGVMLGDGQDYDPGNWPNGDAGAAIRQALADGHRWLVLTDANYPMHSVVDLDQYATDRALRIDGAGAHLTHF